MIKKISDQELMSNLESLLQSRESFVYFRHEVRNSLTSIKGYSELYSQRIKDVRLVSIINISALISSFTDIIHTKDDYGYEPNHLHASMLFAGMRTLLKYIEAILNSPPPNPIAGLNLSEILTNHYSRIVELTSTIDPFEMMDKIDINTQLTRVISGLYSRELPDIEISLTYMYSDKELGRYRLVKNTDGITKEIEDDGYGFLPRFSIYDLVMNLVGNSIKYAWPSDYNGERKIDVTYKMDADGSAELKVWDNGNIDYKKVLEITKDLEEQPLIEFDGDRPTNESMLRLLTSYGFSTGSSDSVGFGLNHGLGLAMIANKKEFKLS